MWLQVVRQDGQEFRGSNFPWSEKIGSLRKDAFGIEAFRGMQETAINCILSGAYRSFLYPSALYWTELSADSIYKE